MNKPVRNFVFTLNNYTESLENEIKEFIKEHCRFGIFGKEIAPTTGTHHLQGYIELSKPQRFTAIKKKLPPGTHLEQRKGTRDQAIQYCKKDGDIWSHGQEISQQGRRTDLDAIRSMALADGLRAVSSVASYQELKVAEQFLVWNEPPRVWKPTVLWFYGATGLGKSRRARWILEQEYGLNPSDIYTKCDGTKWWPGYDSHKGVIIDDFRPSWWSITEMLSLLDRYEKRIEFKGGYRQFRAEYIVVTSCLGPNQCYEGTGEAIQQLLRRIDEVTHFVFEWVPPNEPKGDLQTESQTLQSFDPPSSELLNLLTSPLCTSESLNNLEKTQIWEF